MGLFDKKRNDDISFPEPPAPKIEPAFPEPPANSPDLDMLKEQVEKPAMESPKAAEDNDEMEVMEEPPRSAVASQRSDMIPEPVMPTTINPVLYIKLSEYKEVVEATNSMRKDVEKIKTIVTDLRKIEKEEHSRLEKSEELIRDINKIVNLFEKTMVTPTE